MLYNYTETDSDLYEVEHMSHVISNENRRDSQVTSNKATYETIPGESQSQ